jgi:4-amino-4-deoxy-L-arabinose transferase-like glycosyltransferase
MIITPIIVIFFVSIFVLVFLFVKTIDKRKWLAVLVSLVLTPIVYFYVFYPILNIFSSYHNEKYFNSEVWIEEPSSRYEMTNNILESDTLIGKTKPEIQHLLGTYEWLSWNDSIKNHDDNLWNYALGMKPGAMNTKKECMTLIFKDGKVANIETYNEEITFDDKN